MSSQQAVFADTIVCMKKAIKRKAYDSDSDTSIDKCTNRGNKLRKKARYVRQGQLAPPSGPQAYRRTIEHAGYFRDILYRNPPLVDEDGYKIDSDDDLDDERAQVALAAADQFNPYAQIKLEQILAPLTAASDLPNHPTLSKPFTSQTLTQLTYQAQEMVQKEKNFLWKLKHLMTRMSGDNTWIPCHAVEREDDWALFFDDYYQDQKNSSEKNIPSNQNLQVSDNRGFFGTAQHLPDSIIAAVKQLIAKEQKHKNTPTAEENKKAPSDSRLTAVNKKNPATDSSPTSSKHEKTKILSAHDEREKKLTDKAHVDDLIEDQENPLAPRRMRLRGQAQASSESATVRMRSKSPESNNISYIHPYFLAAQSSRIDRNFGLPSNEATETRRILQLYIQKQEEVCRGVQKIYDGLLKADRCRKLIMKWAKADAHVGINRDMSDGEDWYDNEEWDLDEDLKKGHDEDEEDAATTVKKTRARRQ